MIYYFSATGNSQHVATRIAEALGMQAIDDEQQDDKCFLEYQPEGQFVRGH